MAKSILWFSAGAASAVACKLALEKYNDPAVYFIETGSEDPDSFRFIQDCEKWFGIPVVTLKSKTFSSHWEVIEKTHFLNSAFGARCTKELKRKVRYQLQDELKAWECQIIGYDVTEKKRALRFSQQNPNVKAVYPLIDAGISKSECFGILEKAGIKRPLMYDLGFPNNNCIGCVKGGKGYWNLVKRVYPDAFDRMAKLERKINHSCIKDCYLDELPFVELPVIIPSCSLFCEPDFMDI